MLCRRDQVSDQVDGAGSVRVGRKRGGFHDQVRRLVVRRTLVRDGHLRQDAILRLVAAVSSNVQMTSYIDLFFPSPVDLVRFQAEHFCIRHATVKIIQLLVSLASVRLQC